MRLDDPLIAPPPPRSRTPLMLALLGFVLGLLLCVWAFTSWGPARRWLTPDPAPAAAPLPAALPAQQVLPMDSAPPDESAIAVDPSVAAQLGARVGEIEARIDRVAERANAAGANAARAEGLLVAFAARRALDRGLGLGYIEAQLRERFGATQPQAVAVVVQASRDPVTLEDLQLGLDDLAAGLTSGMGEGVRASLARELGTLFVLRKAGTPSREPGERLRHARRLLSNGQVDKAMLEVARLPGAAKAANWMTAARRFVRARQALDAIETTAILQPRFTATPPPLLPDPAPAR